MKRLIINLIFFTTITSFSQTPGGLGAANINLWYSGDDMGITETTGAFNWPDRSGNNYHAYQNTSGDEPIQLNLFNFNETYTFDGTADFLAITDLNYDAGEFIKNIYGFVVYSSDYTSASSIDNHAFIGFSRNHVFSMALTGEGKLSFRFRDVENNINEELEGSSTSNPNDGKPHVATYIFETGSILDTQIRLDGRVDAAADQLSGDIEARTKRFGYIGDGSNSNSENNGNNFKNFFEGDIAEIILYNQTTAMLSTDLAKIETHLALKYGITIDSSDGSTAGDYINSSNITMWDADVNSTYHNAVGGIINDETVGAIHQKISKPLNSYLTVTTGVTGAVHDFTLENNDVSRTDVNTDTYLMFGENGASFGFEEYDVAGKIILNKKWLFKESSTQSNNVFISVSEELFPTGATVQMIISDDDTYNGSDQIVSLANSGGVYYNNTSINIDNNDRVSFLIDDVKIAGVSLGKIDLHIKADESNIVDGKLTLTDMSLGLSDAVENQTDNRPITTDLMNFNPTLTFDGIDDYLYIKNKYYTIGEEISNLHTFTVFSTDYNDGEARTNSAFIDFDRAGVFSNYIRGDGKLVNKHRSNGSNKTQTGVAILNDNLPHISEAIFNGGIIGDDTFVKYDGLIDNSSEKETGNIIIDKNRYGVIGDESNDDEENGTTRGVNYQGKISEIILSDRQDFTTNETIQIESYLALKYGITLDNSITNYLNSQGTVIWDNATFWNGIAGIIKDDVDSDLDQRIAQSSSAKDIIVSTVSISAPGTPLLTTSNLDTDRTSLNEGSYLLFGNNGKPAGGIEENIALSKSVTTRHWVFKEAGTNLDDNVIVAIPKDYFPEGSTSIVAYISEDDIFNGGDTSVALTSTVDDAYYYFSRDIDDGQFLAYALTPPVITGPGNVSNGLTMWIKADENVTSSGGLLTSILDATLNGNNVLQSDNTEKPNINQSETNYNPTISFDTQHLAIEQLNYNGVGVIEKMYAWIIYKTDYFSANTNAGVDDKNTSFIDFDRTKYFNMHVRGDGKLSMSYRNSISAASNTTNAIGITATNSGITQLGGFVFDNTLTNESIIRLNGSVDYENDLTSNPIGVGVSSEIRYGYVGDGSEATSFNGGTKEDHYDGSISEIIFYEGETLDADDINRVESYLAIKYGITLNGDYVDSTLPTANTVWNATSNTGYNNDIAIIGRDDDSGLYQKQSKSENSDGILTISIDTSVRTSNQENEGILNNLEFLAWGNNSTDENFNVDCGASKLKVNKTWKTQNTGSVGAVTMQFDMSNIPDPGSYELIIDNDNDFTTTLGQTTETGVLTGTNLTFSSINLSDGVFFSLFKSAASDIVYNGSWSGGSGTGGVPDETDLGKRVTIENSVTLTESFKCNCLDVNAGQVITVPTGNFINANKIVLNGDIYLEGTAELIQIGTNTSNSGTGQLYKVLDEATSSQYRYNFFSSPVNTSGTFTIANNLKFNTGGDLGINTNPTFTTDPDGSGTTLSSEWFYDINNTTSFSRITENTALSSGVGFTMKGTGITNKYNFIGSPNNGEINVSIDEDNYVLTGNPYPSSINIDTFSANMVAENITDGAVYLWDQPLGDAHTSGTEDNVGGYATRINGVGTLAVTINDDAITGAQEPEEFIKPGQGFIVAGASDGASIKFTNTLRDGINYVTEASTAHFYKTTQQSSSINSRSIIRLGFEYKNKNDKIFHRQLVTVLEDYNMLEREPGKDAYMLDSYNNDAYWVLPEDDHRFVITGVPSLSEDENLKLPIGVSLDENREVTFKLDDVENIDRYIYLFDAELNSLINIKNNEYKTLVNTGDNIDRFSLIFKEYEENITLNLLDDDEVTSDKIFLYTNNNNLHITKEEGHIMSVKLYDFTGKELIDFQNTSKLSTININTENLNSQLVIVRIMTNNAIFTKRIFINY